MRTLTIIIAATATLLAGQAAAQASASATASGSATIVDPAQIAPGAAMTVAPVAKPSAGSKTARSSEASYKIVGQAGEAYSLAVPSSLKLTRSGGTEEIELKLTPNTVSGTFGGAPGEVSATHVGVAGAAPVTASSTAGVYLGELPVTLTYQ